MDIYTYQKSTGDGHGIPELPFEVKFNFGSLVKYWKEKEQSDDPALAARAKALMSKINHPEKISRSFSSMKTLEKYREDILNILSPFFSPLLTNNEIKACVLPFVPAFINPTDRFKTIIENAGSGENIKMQIPNADYLYRQACLFVLNFYYQAGINKYHSLYYEIPDQRANNTRYYRAFFNADFSSLKLKKGAKKLTIKEIRSLIDNFEDISYWKEKIPPKSFVFEGFGLVTLMDVTADESISRLKLDLLKKDALTSPHIVENIRKNLCSLINAKDLKLGFVSYDDETDQFKSLGYGFWNSIILNDKVKKSGKEMLGEQVWSTLVDSKLPVIVSQHHDNVHECHFIGKLVKNKLESYIAVPMIYADQLIGILEMGSDDPGTLNPVVLGQFESVLSLFVTALKRSLDEYQTGLEAIIQEQCTAIHPSVSWRFFEAAENLVKRQQFFDIKEMEEITFQNVYPLYGQTDLKGSSKLRNQAIVSDLTSQLEKAKGILLKAGELSQLPICDELGFLIENHITSFNEGLGAGDELTILDFLKRDIHPVIQHLGENYSELLPLINAYNDVVNDELGVIYDKRKEYEESITLVNDTISSFLETAQKKAQKMFPHYFEKYKTDGVEHDMYIGQSLVNSRTYDPLYLKNLRLWQLMVTCEIENEVQRIKPQLKLDLDVCSLILVQSNPLAIKFRMDEKRFDVDGTYNIRYEIIKKRIDKATLRNSSERLTQPGKLAIVYSQEKEAKEYVQYLEYLKSINYLTGDIEWLELEDLQGIQRLKALRVNIEFDRSSKSVDLLSQTIIDLENMN